jgi:hypothetical protein
MRALLLVAGVVAAAGGIGWFLLREPTDDSADASDASREVREPSEVGAAPPPAEIRDAAPPPVVGLYRAEEDLDPSEPDPRWVEWKLKLPEGAGPVTGRELLDALEKSRVLFVRATSPDVLEAFERSRLVGLDRKEGAHFAALEPFILEAGFGVRRKGERTLVISRAGEEEPSTPPRPPGVPVPPESPPPPAPNEDRPR